MVLLVPLAVPPPGGVGPSQGRGGRVGGGRVGGGSGGDWDGGMVCGGAVGCGDVGFGPLVVGVVDADGVDTLVLAVEGVLATTDVGVWD